MSAVATLICKSLRRSGWKCRLNHGADSDQPTTAEYIREKLGVFVWASSSCRERNNNILESNLNPVMLDYCSPVMLIVGKYRTYCDCVSSWLIQKEAFALASLPIPTTPCRTDADNIPICWGVHSFLNEEFNGIDQHSKHHDCKGWLCDQPNSKLAISPQ